MILVESLVSLVIIWLMGFLLHELCHIIEAFRQGNNTGYIRVWKSILPSFIAEYDNGLQNQNMFKLAGGLYSGLILLVPALIAYLTGSVPLLFAFLTTAIANLAYAPYEMKYLWKINMNLYSIGRYTIYSAVIVIMLGIFGFIYFM